MNTQTRYDEASGQKLYQPKPVEKMAIVGGSNCEPLLVYWTTKEDENVVRLEDYGKMTAQRDELLAALKAAQPIVESVYLDDEANGKQDNARLGFSVNEQIKEVIAKAESNQT